MMTKIFDPVLNEVMRHELMSVVEEMNITMKQTTRSIAAKEGADFSAGLLDTDGHITVQAIPYGAGYFTGVLPTVLAKFGDNLEPGDVILSNGNYGELDTCL